MNLDEVFDDRIFILEVMFLCTAIISSFNVAPLVILSFIVGYDIGTGLSNHRKSGNK